MNMNKHNIGATIKYLQVSVAAVTLCCSFNGKKSYIMQEVPFELCLSHIPSHKNIVAPRKYLYSEAD